MRLLFLFAAFGCALAASPVLAGPTVAVVTDSKGFVHDVVKPVDGDSTVVTTLRHVVEQRQGGKLVHVPDASQLDLDGVDVVVFYTTGPIPLDVPAFTEWVEAGGGMVGLHCATDTLKDNQDWVDLIGAAFASHPWNANDWITLRRLEDHPIVKVYPSGKTFQEEIYAFRSPPTGVQVLLELDGEKTEIKSEQHPTTPITWIKDVGEGRMAYSSLGHNQQVWESEEYRQHLHALIAHADGEDAAARGRDPWVFRCTLDGRPRVIVVALGQDLWVAYDAQTCNVYKVWTGDIELTGSVYDTRHGPQPKSVGEVLDTFGGEDQWQVHDGKKFVAATPRWIGYSVNGTKSVTFRYAIDGVEIVETVDRADDRTLIRKFVIEDSHDKVLRVQLATGAAELNAQSESDEGGEDAATVKLVAESRGQGVVHFLDITKGPIVAVTRTTWSEQSNPKDTEQ